jgi:hypothetical protein
MANHTNRPQHGANLAASCEPGPTARSAFTNRGSQAKSVPAVSRQSFFGDSRVVSLDVLAPAVLMVRSNAGTAPSTTIDNWENHHGQKMYRVPTRPQHLGRRAGRTAVVQIVLESGRPERSRRMPRCGDRG